MSCIDHCICCGKRRLPGSDLLCSPKCKHAYARISEQMDKVFREEIAAKKRMDAQDAYQEMMADKPEGWS